MCIRVNNLPEPSGNELLEFTGAMNPGHADYLREIEVSVLFFASFLPMAANLFVAESPA
jgi:hypothetical protein